MLGKWERIRHGSMQGSCHSVGYASLVRFIADEKLLLYGSRLQTHVHIHFLLFSAPPDHVPRLKSTSTSSPSSLSR
jgi:hypothetical protein